MKNPATMITSAALTLLATLISGQPAIAVATETLLVSPADYPQSLITTQDAEVTKVRHDDQPVLQVSTGHESQWPGITLPAPGEPWDLSAFTKITVEARNVGPQTVTISCRVDSLDSDETQRSITESIELASGESKRLTVRLRRRLPEALAAQLDGMRGYPGGTLKEGGIDAERITALVVFVNKPQQDQIYQVGPIIAEGTATNPAWRDFTPDQFFPMIDKFGQFLHGDWPGKVTSVEDMRNDIRSERVSLSQQPGPPNWTQYGGWKDGPQLKATGFFYATKYGDKWWLVDPSGKLFWSHGVDCVGFSNAITPITLRESYFRQFPADDSPLAAFVGRASWAPHGFYKDKGTYRTYNFTAANLMRKFGDNWRAEATEMVHARLRSWSLNSIGNWSDANVYLERKTPYVVAAGSHGAKRIEGSSGYWGKFPDPFDPSFRKALDERMVGEENKTTNDPYCIGFFVDNELAWGDEYSLSTAALASPSDQAAKQIFVNDLKQKYSTIERLNQAWQTEHPSWEALRECRIPPQVEYAADDLGVFYSRIADEYFRQCRQAVKEVAPNHLYLGCRFAWVNDRGAQSAAKYCDVLGYNLYRDSVADFQLPDGVDMPAIIGEFHFGALDRGMFHTGLRPTENQDERAEAYRNYVTGALANPCLVGCHWFQYGDQATTGRGDGENYQIGLVSICDRPYPETIDAVREIGSAMYRIRSGPQRPSQR